MRECDYCLKQISHNGDCPGKWLTQPCLIFERDPRGKQAQMRVLLQILLGFDIPGIVEPVELIISGIVKTAKIIRIHHVGWLENGKGLVGIELDSIISYWTE